MTLVRRASLLSASVLVLACLGDPDDTRFDTSSVSGTSGADGSSSSPSDSSGRASVSGDTPSTTTASVDDSTTTTTDASSGSTGGEAFVMTDTLRDGGTMGTALGGSFSGDGWTVTGNADRIYWHVPRLVTGSVEFTLTNVTLADLPLNDHEIFAMYEGGYGIEHPIGYDPEYRNNDFKAMIRIFGQAETPADRIGKQKLLWGMCPAGPPGYLSGDCPCAGAVLDEPLGGDPSWDGSPQQIRIEWGDGVTRYLRNGVEAVAVDWSDATVTFGPEELYISLGTPRPEAVASASMPIGAVFSDVTIEGTTGPAATCG